MAKTKQVSLGGQLCTPSMQHLELFFWFMAERNSIFVKRSSGQPPPWTEDKTMQTQRFCDLFRVRDRGTQYLLANVIGQGDSSARETLFRIMLYRFFNRPETWERFEEAFGAEGMTIGSFNRVEFDQALAGAFHDGESLYGGAYIIPSPRILGPGTPAFRNHLHLLERMIKDGVLDKILRCENAQKAHELLILYPGVGEFIAYQLVLDFTLVRGINWDENVFTTTGPGSQEGLKIIFKTPMNSRTLAAHAIQWLYREQDEYWERLGIVNIPCIQRNGHATPPQVPDIEHALCEYAKYVRMSNTRDGHAATRRPPFNPSEKPLTFLLPTKWAVPSLPTPEPTPETESENPIEDADGMDVNHSLDKELHDAVNTMQVDADNSLAERENDPDADSTKDPDVYEVSHIVAERHNQGGEVQYKVRWVGYEPKDDTWLDYDAFENAQEVLKAWSNRPQRAPRNAKVRAAYAR